MVRGGEEGKGINRKGAKDAKGMRERTTCHPEVLRRIWLFCDMGQILRSTSDGMKKKVRCLTYNEVAAVGGRAPRKGTDPWTV